jgi:hypothetical protein
MDQFSVDQLVSEAVRQYEEETGLSISSDAASILLSRGKEHEDQIKKDLETGHATVPFLHGVLLEVLRRAGAIARSEQHSSVEVATLELALKEDCPYLGWC